MLHVCIYNNYNYQWSHSLRIHHSQFTQNYPQKSFLNVCLCICPWQWWKSRWLWLNVMRLLHYDIMTFWHGNMHVRMMKWWHVASLRMYISLTFTPTKLIRKAQNNIMIRFVHWCSFQFILKQSWALRWTE